LGSKYNNFIIPKEFSLDKVFELFIKLTLLLLCGLSESRITQIIRIVETSHTKSRF